MAQKKYLSLERLEEYDALIKAKVDSGDATTLSSSKSYTDAEVAKIKSGTITVSKAENAEHATTSDSATNATNAVNAEHADTADSATTATTAETANAVAWANVTGKPSTYAPSSHNHDDRYYTETEVDTLLSGKSDSTHKHDNDYDAKGAAATALASAQTYADNAATTVKNDLLNGAGTAYDTLKELGDLIVDNADAIDALETIASGKADAVHSHAIADVTGLQSALDGKAAASHGTHVTFDSTNKPKMDGTAAFGTSTNVARADHVHPTDTSRAAQTDLDELAEVVAGKAAASHTHAISEVTNLQTTLDGKQATITGAATTIASSNLTANRALISNGSGKVAVSDVTSTELGYLDGVTSNVQTQLDGKAASGHGHSDATTSAAGFMTAAMVTKLNGIAEGANKITVDSALSASSTNPVQNKAVNSAINSLTSTVSTNTSSISANSTAISNLQTEVAAFTEITSAEISALFA